MAGKLDMEVETRPGRVVLRFAAGGETTEYPLSADGAEQLAATVERAAEQARAME